MYICESVRCSVMSDSLRPHGPEPTRLLCLQNSPGKNIELGTYFLSPGVFPTRDQTQGTCAAGRFFTI